MFEAPLRICCPFPGIKQWSTFEPDPTVTIPQPFPSSSLSPPFQEQDHSIQIRFYSERERKWDRHAAWSRSTALCPLPFCHRSTRELRQGGARRSQAAAAVPSGKPANQEETKPAQNQPGRQDRPHLGRCWGQQAKLVTTTQWPEDDFTSGLREL